MPRFRINSKTVLKRSIGVEDILPRIGGNLTVRYAQKEYRVIGYLDDRVRLILKDPQQSDCELIVEMEQVKPLLRKMDSMSLEEKLRYQELLDGVANRTKGVWEVIEWLNDKQFDYKDLIGEGLAEKL